MPAWFLILYTNPIVVKPLIIQTVTDCFPFHFWLIIVNFFFSLSACNTSRTFMWYWNLFSIPEPVFRYFLNMIHSPFIYCPSCQFPCEGNVLGEMQFFIWLLLPILHFLPRDVVLEDHEEVCFSLARSAVIQTQLSHRTLFAWARKSLLSLRDMFAFQERVWFLLCIMADINLPEVHLLLWINGIQLSTSLITNCFRSQESSQNMNLGTFSLQ